jgi:hypothetical protein
MAKKLEKKIEGTVVTLTSEGVAKSFDFANLPADIQTKFGPFGLGHKLGDAAAGKEGVEIFAAIEKVWEGLEKGDWSVRAPAGEKVNVKTLLTSVDALDASDEEKERLRQILALITAPKAKKE